MCVTDRHDITLAVKVALNPQYNQPLPTRSYGVNGRLLFIRVTCSYQSNFKSPERKKKMVITVPEDYQDCSRYNPPPHYHTIPSFSDLENKKASENIVRNVRNGDNPFPNNPWFFTCLQYKSFENTVEKGEIARNEQFLLFPKCFLLKKKKICHFH